MQTKRWHIKSPTTFIPDTPQSIIEQLLVNRAISSAHDMQKFLLPQDPYTFSAADVGMDEQGLGISLDRIRLALKENQSIVVYADYDADGITAGAIMWEALHKARAKVMPYIPHREKEGYGFSKEGIDTVIREYNPQLIITVDHGISAREKITYAISQGVDVVVTDHHTKPEMLPQCPIVHTTTLCGAGVSWFVTKELFGKANPDHVALATIGTIADMMQLVGPNRSMVKYGLAALRTSDRMGLLAILEDAGVEQSSLGVYEISHLIAPRLNAMGRMEHAMDSLRLLCTTSIERSTVLARQLGLTNKERQRVTEESSIHAKTKVAQRFSERAMEKLLFVADPSYNPGIIGLVAGRLVEEYYRPSVVVSIGDGIAKASARSIAGFSIIDALRAQSDILKDVGGHPMAAGFAIEVDKLPQLQERLEEYAREHITDDMLTRIVSIDMSLPLSLLTYDLWERLQELQPFGPGNHEPTFVTNDIAVTNARLLGRDGKHLRLSISPFGDASISQNVIAFGYGPLYAELSGRATGTIVYTIDMNTWNGKSTLQLKLKDIRLGSE